MYNNYRCANILLFKMRGNNKLKIITVATIKGGTGKTSTAGALAQAAAMRNKKALAIDLDPQGNLSLILGADLSNKGSYDALNGSEIVNLIKHTSQNIDILTASPDLATEKTKPGSAKRLRNALVPIVNNYDLIIIDTPPHMGEMTFNALQASTDLIIPLEPDTNSLQGLYQITDIARQIQQSNPDLKITGIVLTRYDSRPKINKYMHDAITLRGKEMDIPLLTEIRPGIAIREAQAMRRSLYEYAGDSKPAQDYLKLYDIIFKSAAL